jgi:hypothetical protein
MANELNELFSICNTIELLRTRLKNLEEEKKVLINQIITSGKTENRYYRLDKDIIPGNRVIDPVLLKNKYPEVYNKCLTETVLIKDAQKLLGDNQITEVSTMRHPIIKYKVTKKSAEPVIVA